MTGAVWHTACRSLWMALLTAGPRCRRNARPDSGTPREAMAFFIVMAFRGCLAQLGRYLDTLKC